MTTRSAALKVAAHKVLLDLADCESCECVGACQAEYQIAAAIALEVDEALERAAKAVDRLCPHKSKRDCVIYEKCAAAVRALKSQL